MATIKPIEAKTVHQIQSGQVIVDLCSVVKELVENSIDAGASNIEVRFKNQGLDAIEVHDNGSGISKENYDTLALKHYTSKLSTYADLEALETFGFRGEALSSLCALSKFTVTTCLASDAPKGSRLAFEPSGKLRSTSVVAAQKGTTVSIEDLFYNLPVRRRELERNIKREWSKVLGVLNQYACIQTGLKFSVSQQPTKGKRIVLFSTKGNKTTRENIANVFGAKTLSVLIPLELELELEQTSTPNRRLIKHEDDQAKIIRIKGHVSRPAHGEGRQTPDRQMFFVNGRPCGLPQFAKVFNEVYKTYNSSQSPFIFADIQLDTHLYDVNVSPDKRTILLHDQTRMLDNLRESLGALFESQDYALPTSQLQVPKQSLLKTPSQNRQDGSLSKSGPEISLPMDIDLRDRSTSADLRQTPDGEHAKKAEAKGNQGPLADDIQDRTGTSVQPANSNHLLSHWAERNCELRVNAEEENTASGGNISKNNQSSYVDSRSCNSPHPEKKRAFAHKESADTSDNETGFQARLEQFKEGKADGTSDQLPQPDSAAPEPPVPSITAPTRTTGTRSILQFPSPSTKRPAPEVATITIGDHTVTSVIGGPAKRKRLEYERTREHSARKRNKDPGPVPSFHGRLTQMFAAQAHRAGASNNDIDVTTEGNGDESDDSGGGLFVNGDADEAEKDSAQESESEKPDTEEDEERTSPQNSPMSVADPKEDLENQQPGSTDDSSDSESNQDEGDDEEKKNESHVDENIEDIQTGEEMISEESERRTKSFVKGNTRKKDATYYLQQTLRVDPSAIRDAYTLQQEHAPRKLSNSKTTLETDRLDAEDAEEKLSLTISKSDFERMKIIGQFNLGFILASRAAESASPDSSGKCDRDDELFIIDQHATDEKYNFERLQASTVVQSQRLVRPKTLELTAMEEDIVQENMDALEANGFIVSFDGSGDEPVGSRCQLLSLPLSRETTFSLADLEELISLLMDHQSSSENSIPRPSKVRKMFAMRACRSSVMIGKPLSIKQMEKLVRHMGEIDKPWNCPHGRPTMRHLCGLGAWDELGWKEGVGFDGNRASPVNWAAYLQGEGDLG
ncbi:DNA mismatch repair protein MutL [Poronia punctata]|nr:DNA mismatch repair protein MutL [Poronia punctata]